MSVTTADLIQLLQLIVLAFTAVIFISQFILRLFLSDQALDVVNSTKDGKPMDKLRNGVQLFFLSTAFFMVSGSVVSVYLILIAVPGEVDYFMTLFQASLNVIGGGVLIMIIAIAWFISGDYENPHTGVKGVLIASVLSGGASMFIIVLYGTLWAATRSIEWVFFISAIGLACAMFTLLFGALSLSEVFLDVLETQGNN